MAIYLGSRYEDSVVDFLSTTPTFLGPIATESVTPVVFYEFSRIGKVEYVSYSWKTGDRLDSLAFKFYGQSDRWWLIMEYNPEIKDPFNIPDGTELRIPNV